MVGTLEGIGRFVTGGLGPLADDVLEGSTAEGPVIVPADSDSDTRAITEGDRDRLVSMPGILKWGAQASEDGAADFVFLLALVNISIGVLNLLPLLPLDGGHAAIAIYERIRSIGGRRHMADVSRLLPLTYGVALIGLLVMMSAVYLDIVDPVTPG
jgi:Zn-dependent protease